MPDNRNNKGYYRPEQDRTPWQNRPSSRKAHFCLPYCKGNNKDATADCVLQP